MFRSSMGFGMEGYGVPAIRPGAVYHGVARCAHTPAGRRIGKLLLGAALVHVGLKLYSRYKLAQHRKKWANAGNDVVVLHQFERATNAPNMSPFAIKLETFLRMAGIKYIVDNDYPQHEITHKCPWITINGTDLKDSELIMDYLMQHFKKPIDEQQLTPVQHATGRVVQIMLDEHLLFLIAAKAYAIDNGEFAISRMPSKYHTFVRLMWPLIKRFFTKLLYVTGAGRFTEREVLFFLYRDLTALQALLGDKQFLLSDQPSTYDACAFAELTQVIHGCAPEVERHVRANFAPLVQYHERMRDKYWPDYDECRAE